MSKAMTTEWRDLPRALKLSAWIMVLANVGAVNVISLVCNEI